MESLQGIGVFAATVIFLKRSVKFAASVDATICCDLAASRQRRIKFFSTLPSNLPLILL
jgi:hypothetical protein